MPILDCNVQSCFHNKENQCCLDSIKIDGGNAQTSTQTECKSFKEKTGDSFSNCDSGSPNLTSDVNCEATHCVFNDNCTCNADHIAVAGGNACKCGETQCSSFYTN